MLRRLGIAIALAVGLLAAVAAALIAYRTEVAEAALIRWLAARGAEAPALTVTGLDLQGLHLGGLRLGARGELRAEAVRAAPLTPLLGDSRCGGREQRHQRRDKYPKSDARRLTSWERGATDHVGRA